MLAIPLDPARCVERLVQRDIFESAATFRQLGLRVAARNVAANKEISLIIVTAFIVPKPASA